MMHEEERNLDRHIENMRKSMQVLLEDPAHKGNLYIAEDDISNPVLRLETLVAVRAPHGTTLEVPDPDEGGDGGDEKRYQIFLKSAAGPVRGVPRVPARRPGRAADRRGPVSCGERPVAGRARGRLRLVTRGGQKRKRRRENASTSTRGARRRRAFPIAATAGNRTGRTGRRDAHLATLVRPGLLVLGRG